MFYRRIDDLRGISGHIYQALLILELSFLSYSA
ncbi:hypothetical protein T11_15632 [Trichinella zimbabwensis]|uniref:Uncharacterized protein n=1 Tax=Trichinella zimbabwensis TaxID=268475 RepID=A0A0V1DSQ0_9BILA|nr:hypothetical protein T11_15632 [Trichinella zimbabwensis]